MTDILKISVIGHTNTGKTSLLRTLTRNARFGQVSGRPGTTRHVEVARLLVDGRALLELYDTPGIEESIDLLTLLDEQSSAAPVHAAAREEGPTRVRRFLDSEPARGRFEQEAKVLRQLLRSDAAFYVIDARDPVLAKHRDELEIFRLCGVPLLPLLNFVTDSRNNERKWREALAALGLHAIVRFDTVAPAQDGEKLLYTKLASLLDSHSEALQKLISSHEDDARRRHLSAMQLIAGLLIETAAMKLTVSANDAAAFKQALNNLNQRVSAREQQCVEHLLSLYRFYPDDVEIAALPLVDGRWEQNVFDPVVLQQLGIRVGGGAAAGAAAGLGIDLLVGGITLGAAAATGALLGGGVQTLRHYGTDLLARLTGEKSLRVDDTILNALCARQASLVIALEARGHASQHKLLQPDSNSSASGRGQQLFSPGQVPVAIRSARSEPAWASSSIMSVMSADKQVAVDSLAADLDQWISELRQHGLSQ
jgi:GTPase SAR1 family protein